jgi:RNA-directed DNA polymerase
MPPEAKHSLIRICALATGLTLNEVVSIAGIGPKRYKVYQIPKRSGGQRTICHPSRELKALQYVFLREILADLPVHEAATAYRRGSSIKENASRHLSSRIILKLDFENFFPSIKVADWAAYARAMLPHWTEQDIAFSTYVMFWGAGDASRAARGREHPHHARGGGRGRAPVMLYSVGKDSAR